MEANNSTPPTTLAPAAAESASTSPSAAPPDTTLTTRLDALQEQLTKAHAALDRIERLRRIESLLRAAKVTDIATASELVEHTLAEGGGKLEVEAAIEQVRRKRPALFKPAAPPASAMSGRAPSVTPAQALEDLARRIGAGEHRSIMEYMRARRHS